MTDIIPLEVSMKNQIKVYIMQGMLWIWVIIND